MRMAVSPSPAPSARPIVLVSNRVRHETALLETKGAERSVREDEHRNVLLRAELRGSLPSLPALGWPRSRKQGSSAPHQALLKLRIYCVKRCGHFSRLPEAPDREDAALRAPCLARRPWGGAEREGCRGLAARSTRART